MVKGLHAIIKQFLWSLIRDLVTVFQRFQKFWGHQALKIITSKELDKIKILTFILKPVYIIIRERVSSQALQLLENQHRKIRVNSLHKPQRPAGSYPCGFITNHGLPCQHVIFEHIQANQPLTLKAFDQFWHKSVGQGMRVHNAPLEPMIISFEGQAKGIFEC